MFFPAKKNTPENNFGKRNNYLLLRYTNAEFYLIFI